MTGKSHLTIGVATGAAMVFYAAGTGQPLLSLGMITAPLGAMFPDIDHNSSKIGAERQKIFKMQKKLAIVILVVSILLGSIGSFWYGMALFNKVLCFAIFIPLLILIATSETCKKRFPFLVKHRGIMHTLLVPLIVLLAVSRIEAVPIQGLLMGFILGYISHLEADMTTVMGAPIAFPVSKDNVSLLPVRTGTMWEYIVAALLCIANIMFGFMLVKNPNYIAVLGGVMTYAVGYVLPRKVVAIIKKFSKTGRLSLVKIIPVGIIALIIGLVLHKKAAGVLLIFFGLGWIISLIKSMVNSSQKGR